MSERIHRMALECAADAHRCVGCGQPSAKTLWGSSYLGKQRTHNLLPTPTALQNICRALLLGGIPGLCRGGVDKLPPALGSAFRGPCRSSFTTAEKMP
jgi:hypothetical protein